MDQEEVIEWINQIIAGSKFAIEFFKNRQNCFGSEIDSKELLDSSYEKLEQFTGYYGLTRLLSIVDTLKSEDGIINIILMLPLFVKIMDIS